MATNLDLRGSTAAPEGVLNRQLRRDLRHNGVHWDLVTHRLRPVPPGCFHGRVPPPISASRRVIRKRAVLAPVFDAGRVSGANQHSRTLRQPSKTRAKLDGKGAEFHGPQPTVPASHPLASRSQPISPTT